MFQFLGCLWGLFLLSSFLGLFGLFGAADIFPYNIYIFVAIWGGSLLFYWVAELLFGKKRVSTFMNKIAPPPPPQSKQSQKQKETKPFLPDQYIITGIGCDGKRIAPRTVNGTENIQFYTYGIQHGTVWIVSSGKRIKYMDIHN